MLCVEGLRGQYIHIVCVLYYISYPCRVLLGQRAPYSRWLFVNLGQCKLSYKPRVSRERGWIIHLPCPICSSSRSLVQVQMPSEYVYDSFSYFFFLSSDETTLISQGQYMFVSEASHRINYLMHNFVCVCVCSAFCS